MALSPSGCRRHRLGPGELFQIRLAVVSERRLPHLVAAERSVENRRLRAGPDRQSQF
jgi:hypothetical protein